QRRPAWIGDLALIKPSGQRIVQLFAPVGQRSTTYLDGQVRIAQVVRLAHKRVQRAHCQPPRLWQYVERDVEVSSRSPGEPSAIPVRITRFPIVQRHLDGRRCRSSKDP